MNTRKTSAPQGAHGDDGPFGLSVTGLDGYIADSLHSTSRMRIRKETLAIAIAVTLSLLACKGGSRTDETVAARRADGVATTAGAARDDSLLSRADKGRILGSDSAKVWVIEVSDFECPYCAVWHNTVYDSLRRGFIETGQVRFAYLNYPIASHRHAWPAAIRAMCAAAQDKFWPVQSAIFRSQERWTALPDAIPFFDSLVVAQGVDAGRLRACVESEATRPLIQADMDRAIDAGVNATPYFLIGDTRLSGVQPIDRLRAAIETELRKQQRTGS
jgi:protein-disulfide isomerase